MASNDMIIKASDLHQLEELVDGNGQSAANLEEKRRSGNSSIKS